MKYLYLMRHGQSKKTEINDFFRPLSLKGNKDVLIQAEQFKLPTGIRPDCIYCSTAVRTKQTAELLKTVFKGVPVFYRETLYLAPSYRIMDVIKETDEIFQRIMVIGHHPGLEQTLGVIADNGNIRLLKPADCAVLSLNIRNWTELKTACGHLEQIYATI